ncbi:MAG: hypothetical protein J3Q66DRAFT_369541 [Benniella sp.]|nr:MAG: hypothetical protein J3Q66DRAFT_369541 [Benniella sp.]
MYKYVLVASALAAVCSAYTLLTACTNINLSNCMTFEGDLHTCYGVEQYDESISSAKVHGAVICRLYRDAGCIGPGPIITDPAYNLNDQGFANVTSSFKCWLD